MKKRFCPEQIIGILKEGQGEGTAREVCARHNVSEPTYSRWKRVYGGMEVAVERPHPSLVHHLQFSQGGVTMYLKDPKAPGVSV
ncbi:MAG: transposase [Verrucomicrobiae bacterium]|nr:transposase [Verrucomicrobiae bacterium]